MAYNLLRQQSQTNLCKPADTLASEVARMPQILRTYFDKSKKGAANVYKRVCDFRSSNVAMARCGAERSDWTLRSRSDDHQL